MAQVRLVRDINQARALLRFTRGKSFSRAQLARELKTTRSTASALASVLMADGLLIEDAAPSAGLGVGRPGTALRLNPAGASFLGAEFSNDHMTVVGLRLDGEVVVRERRPIPGDPTMDEVVAQLCGLAQQVSEDHAAELPRLRGLGVSVPGMLERDGTIYWLPSLHWKGVDLREHLETRLDMPVILENDANAAAIAELLLAFEAPANDFLYLMLDDGVGSGVVTDRTLARGAHGITGETGHMRLDPHGVKCVRCGGLGCFETLVNNAALVRYCREFGGKADTAAEVLRQAGAGMVVAEEALDRWFYWLARGIATLLFAFDPGEVILGGTLAGLVPDLLERLGPLLAAERVPKSEEVKISLSTFGQDGGAVGGAALLYQNIFQVPWDDPGLSEVLARALATNLL